MRIRSSSAPALAWAAFGASLGMLAGALLAAVNPSVRGRDAVVLCTMLAALYAIGAAAVGLLVVPTRRSLPPAASGGGRLAAFGAEVLRALLTAAVAGGGLALASLVERRWPRHLAEAAALGLGLAVALLAPRLGSPTARRWLRAAALLPIAVGLASLAWVAWPGPPESGAAAASVAVARDARLILIGVDGADWKRIDALRARGALPNLDRLIRRGTRTPLRTTVPTWSPILWSTVATGVDARHHGILDFTETRIPGLRRGIQRLRKEPTLIPRGVGLEQIDLALFRLGGLREIPVTSCQRRAPALWNLLSARGARSAVVNWFASFPSEAIDGYVVSDNSPSRAAFLLAKIGAVAGGTRRVTYPESLLAELAPLPLPEVADAPDAILALPFFAELAPADRKKLHERGAGLLQVFRQILRSDAFSAASAAHLAGREKLRFLAVYLSGVDNVSHRFGTLPGVVDRYYQYTDELFGPILASADENTTVLLLSDHGWEYEEGARFGHEHAPDGVLVLAGRGVREGAVLAEAPSLFDVAPTALALFGLPASEQMPGRAIVAALTPEAAARAQAPRIASYGPYAAPTFEMAFAAGANGLEDETMERLRALGYVDE